MNNESLKLIQYKWQRGVYTIQKMVQKVQKKELTEEQFFDITRKSYKSMAEQIKGVS